MLNTMRAELIRLQRRSFVLGWFGLGVVFTALISVFVITAAAEGTVVPDNAPGGPFPDLRALEQASGLVSGFGAAATLLGVVTLSFWALATASDYSIGLIRVLASAQPSRVRLLAGKVSALVLCTAMVTAVALGVALLVGPPIAEGSGVSTALWRETALGTVAEAWLHMFVSLLVWGVAGLVVSVLTRSAAVAISIGVGYVLVVENLVGLVAEGVSDWLPGATLRALSAGGTEAVPFATALGLGLTYVTIGLVVAVVQVKRRDITD